MRHHFRAASLVAASSESFGGVWTCRFPIWPEWNDADVNKEKWDSSKGAEDGRTNKTHNAVNTMDDEMIKTSIHSLTCHQQHRLYKELQNVYFASDPLYD